MMMTVSLILALAAFIVAVLSAIGKAPLWVAVILICVLLLVERVPSG